MPTTFVPNALCSCGEDQICASCRFCQAHNTSAGRKALCEKITRFLVFQPFYQRAIAQAIQKLFPEKIVYDDEKDICTMVFESVLFEDTQTGRTPLSYFVNNAPLSVNEKRLYEFWRTHTRFGFFAVEKVTPGKEVHLAELAGERRYRVYEERGTATIKPGMALIARIVPFLKGWMFTTESIVSFSGSTARQQVLRTYGTAIPQFVFAQKYHEDRKRRGYTC